MSVQMVPLTLTAREINFLRSTLKRSSSERVIRSDASPTAMGRAEIDSLVQRGYCRLDPAFCMGASAQIIDVTEAGRFVLLYLQQPYNVIRSMRSKK